MYTNRQISRVLDKLKRLELTLEPLMFQKIAQISLSICQTDGHYTSVPVDAEFQSVPDGTTFYGEGIYCWEKGQYTVPEQYSGQKLYFYPHTQAYEGLMFVDDLPYGNFSTKIMIDIHGNHYCNMFCQNAIPGKTYTFAIEYYANHFIKATQPFQPDDDMEFKIVYHPADICILEEDIADFYYHLKIANQMASSLDPENFRQAELTNALLSVHEVIYYDPENVSFSYFLEGIHKGNDILKKVLSHKNADSAPFIGMVGHSHMDTAWLWYRKETEKKCARTYSNQINLMDQYPEYTFIQSSAYHSDIIRRLYPALFEKIKEKVAEGRYEPNGGIWVECDCNIPSGEYIIRQFLIGQRFTRKYFNYTADTFWLPDTFGYSAALPQIMNGCGIRYFLTTKIGGNDTNRFPYDTFIWKGIDGSKVLTHFNRSHLRPNPENMLQICKRDSWGSIREHNVSNQKLFSYGFGDGGGGPEFEMIEMIRRMGDIEGLPRTEHTTVSAFMQHLEKTITNPSVYAGELYLELHRGTLTNQHTIKRNNRKTEISLRNLEYLTVLYALHDHLPASMEEITPLMEEFLVNQFHDILPGTGIHRVNQEAIQAVEHILFCSSSLQEELLIKMRSPDPKKLTLINPLSFTRNDILYLPWEGHYIAGVCSPEPSLSTVQQQLVTDICGNQKLAVSGIHMESLSSTVLSLTSQSIDSPKTPFNISMDLKSLETPFYSVLFNEKGYISSLIDKRVSRQLQRGQYALNTFLIGEEVSLGWDCWDVDADFEVKLKDTAQLIDRKLISIGCVECRIRGFYQLTEKSSLTQDMIFYADTPQITFETQIDWQDNHRFLKTSFDTSIQTDGVRQEIQFGYLRRPNHRNTSLEKAKFEVCNHKYTDLSELRYGISLFNDCKYGISVYEGSMRLSLHKGGCRPDEYGDKGIHECTYALYPHIGEFSGETVVQPAYALNIPPISVSGSLPLPALLQADTSNIIVESIKPLEETQLAYLLRIYECEGSTVNTTLHFSHPVKHAELTNMLEETQEILPAAQDIHLTFRPFEIKSLKIYY